MTSPPRPAFSLIDEPWIPVLDTDGRRRDVGLSELFQQAQDLRMLACELPSQTFAILRLVLAILHRATDGPPGIASWQALWREPTLPLHDITEYLDAFRDRFDLLHAEQPFYQVADLRAASDGAFGLERLIADVPNNLPFLTARAGRGLAFITPAEAARWLVHCQAYDPSGIKTGAVGDPRVQGGKVYAKPPLGVAPAGALGGVHLEGGTLRETLLLNLIPIAPGWRQQDEHDVPAWELQPRNATADPAAAGGPRGLLSLYTWQARRLRLFGDRDGITGAMISYGDQFDWQDRHLLEPMSVWGRSGAREKQQKRTPVYLPRPHDTTRALWRGLQTLLPPPSPEHEPAQRLSPMVLQWLAQLTVTGLISDAYQVRSRATSMAYGTQQAVVDDVYGDALTMNVLVLVEGSALRTAAVDSATDAEQAVKVLRTLAANLARAAGGSADDGAAERAAERGYALLDRAFRHWLAGLGPSSDAAAERAAWQRTVRRAIARLGRELVDAAGPAAWVGRVQQDRNGRELHYSSSQAEVWFRSGLARALPMAAGILAQPDQTQPQEVRP
ncbi:type I-E CRISPR-associated protein Cse1/CasA [Dactylosporangium sp. NPDC000244]|uniref:type I-E CRISPR-associated protein Cse1/CasA n=1 Tax=Dactylosporangium sp. NPDC000244 TaxID=3154365 RepID=UPI003319C04C